jgi:hypothetical protein
MTWVYFIFLFICVLIRYFIVCTNVSFLVFRVNFYSCFFVQYVFVLWWKWAQRSASFHACMVNHGAHFEHLLQSSGGRKSEAMLQTVFVLTQWVPGLSRG